MRYAVEQVDKERARDELLRVWRDNLPVRGSCAEKFAWTFERAPSPPLSPLLLVVRRGGDRAVVGSAGVAQRQFEVDGLTARAGLLADLAVDRDHRSLLPALSLVRRARDAAKASVPFAYGFPNRKAEPVFLRAGYAKLGGMTRYVRVLRHGPYAQRIVRWRLPARGLGLLADAGGRARRAAAFAGAAARYRLTITDAVDERAQEVWEEAAPRYRVAARRSADFLAWRLCDHPLERHRFAWLEERRGGRARAYAAVAHEDGALAVRDFFGAPEMLPPLFERLAHWARAEGARSLALRFLGDRRVTAALHRSGFRPRDASRAVVASAFAPGYELVRDPESWYLTDADEDT